MRKDTLKKEIHRECMSIVFKAKREVYDHIRPLAKAIEILLKEREHWIDSKITELELMPNPDKDVINILQEEGYKLSGLRGEIWIPENGAD